MVSIEVSIERFVPNTSIQAYLDVIEQFTKTDFDC
jgi:hypothetical protein